MQNNFKIINESNQALVSKRTILQKKIATLEKEIVNLKLIYPKGTTKPKKPVASPALMVAGKDSSNLLMAVDLPKVQQTQGTVDFPTNQYQQNNPGQTQCMWDTLGQPSGKFDYLVKYCPASPENPCSPQNVDSQTSLHSKGKEILQVSQDPEDVISINKLLSQIQEFQKTTKSNEGTSKRKKKIIKKKKKSEDVKEKLDEAINKALNRIFARKKDSKEKKIQKYPQRPK
ncbi:Uncharacterized protein Adt_20382 [Abeliophyllum distichum]|uniref:Uncharacterized protein n=1 Tax=Abeliophyllum distichum TaxID=126358 RepID=A0ABD1SWF2_9LAMI